MKRHHDLPIFYSNKYWSRRDIVNAIDDVDDNHPYSNRFHQITDCVNQSAVRQLLSPWLLDMDQLRSRRQGTYDRPLPRITFTGRLNTQGNLSIFWEPTYYGENRDCDFSSVPSYGSDAWGSRPNCELLFFRGVEKPLNTLAEQAPAREPVENNLPGQYIREINSRIYKLLDELSWHFEITKNVHITIKGAETQTGDIFVSEAYLESTSERDERLLGERRANAAAQIDAFEETYGFSLDRYFEVRESVPTETLIGNPMTDMGRNRHVSKILRADGHDVDGRTVKAIENLLDELKAVSPEA